MGGGKGSAPPAPNYQPLAASSLEAANVAAKTSADQLDWAKQQYADQAPQTKAYMQSMIDSSNQNMPTRRKLRAGCSPPTTRSRTSSPRGPAIQRSGARGGALSRGAGGRGKHVRQQRRPPCSRWRGSASTPARRAMARWTWARASRRPPRRRQRARNRATRAKRPAWRSQGEAINIGRGYPGQVAQAYGPATQTGNAGISAGLNTSSTYGNLMGSPATWAGMQSSNLSNTANIMNTGFQNQMAGFNANAAIAQNTSSGIGSLAGAAIGAGAIII